MRELDKAQVLASSSWGLTLCPTLLQEQLRSRSTPSSASVLNTADLQETLALDVGFCSCCFEGRHGSLPLACPALGLSPTPPFWHMQVLAILVVGMILDFDLPVSSSRVLALPMYHQVLFM